MIAEPKTRTALVKRGDEWVWGNDEVQTVPSRLADGLYIECEFTHPPSAARRGVTLRITPECADAMLRSLREYAVELRR